MDLSSARDRRRLLIPGAVAAAGVVAAVVVVSNGDDPAGDASADAATFSEKVSLVAPAEWVASRTLRDWALTADYVISATVVAEEKAAGDSETGVGREVTIERKRVLWRSRAANQPAPTTFSMSAYGWGPGENGSLVETAASGGSRLEVGHDYVIAVAWSGGQCSEGETTAPAGWTHIGSGAAVPADDGVIGDGEFEGTTVRSSSVRQKAAGPSGEPVAVVVQFAGKQPRAITKRMKKLRVRPAKASVFRASADAACGAG